ncbi:MAG: WD40/YVTN/BNR-like repeat-containing protein, partial [Ktedonobacterales bacterium]
LRRRAPLLFSIVTLLLGTAALGGTVVLTRPTHAAATKHTSLWKPVDHAGEQAYWTARNGAITCQDLANARAQAAKLPSAAQLPATNHPVAAGGVGGSTPQAPSGNWHPIGPAPINVGYTTYSGRVSALAVDPTTSGASTTIYLGAAGGGVWKSVNNGVSWGPLTDGQQSLAIGAIALDPNNSQIVYVGTGEPNQSADSYFGDGILKSTNGGATWTLEGQAFFGDRVNAIQKIIVNPRDSSQIFVAYTSGFALSTDGGVTYTLISSGIPTNYAVDDLGINPTTNPVTLYATVRANGMYESTTGGTSWAALTTGLPTAGNWYRSALAVAPSNPSVLYTVVTDGAGNPSDVYDPAIPYNGGYYSTNG